MKKSSKGRTSILIIYTGGTIGMVQNPHTGTLAPVKFDQLLSEIPELNKFNYDIRAIAFDPPLDSSNISPSIWLKIAKTIRKSYNDFDGFVVLHGTETKLMFLLGQNLGPDYVKHYLDKNLRGEISDLN